VDRCQKRRCSQECTIWLASPTFPSHNHLCTLKEIPEIRELIRINCILRRPIKWKWQSKEGHWISHTYYWNGLATNNAISYLWVWSTNKTMPSFQRWFPNQSIPYSRSQHPSFCCINDYALETKHHFSFVLSNLCQHPKSRLLSNAIPWILSPIEEEGVS
jgi:hypothetical protein